MASENEHNGYKDITKGIGNDGPFKKWMKPGDFTEGVYLKKTLEPSKFNEGGNIILYWRCNKTDTNFRTRATAQLARIAEDGAFKEGTVYKIILKGTEYTAKGFQVKNFQVLEAEPF